MTQTKRRIPGKELKWYEEGAIQFGVWLIDDIGKSNFTEIMGLRARLQWIEQ